MVLYSSRLAATTYLFVLIWICHLLPACAADKHKSPSNDTHQGLLCTPFGACEPCPEYELSQPFCQPFGNRRLMHCVSANSSESPSHEPLNPPSQKTPSSGDFKSQHPEGETPAWESCGRIVAQERADFYEFVACNILFAVVALAVVFARSKRLHALHARHLAARIGIIRGASGGGRR